MTTTNTPTPLTVGAPTDRQDETSLLELGDRVTGALQIPPSVQWTDIEISRAYVVHCPVHGVIGTDRSAMEAQSIRGRHWAHHHDEYRNLDRVGDVPSDN